MANFFEVMDQINSAPAKEQPKDANQPKEEKKDVSKMSLSELMADFNSSVGQADQESSPSTSIVTRLPKKAFQSLAAGVKDMHGAILAKIEQEDGGVIAANELMSGYVEPSMTELAMSGLRGKALQEELQKQRNEYLLAIMDEPAVPSDNPEVMDAIKQYEQTHGKYPTNADIHEYRVFFHEKHRDKRAIYMREYIKQYPEPDSETSGVIEDGITALPRFFPTMILSGANPAAGLFATYQQLKGGKYVQYRENNVDPKVADTASTISALLSTPAEFLGNVFQINRIGKVFNLIGTKGKIPQKIVNYVQAMSIGSVSEGVEEWTQQHAEVLADLYAANPEAPVEELIQMTWEKWYDPKFQKDARKAGVTGTVAGLVLPVGGGIIESGLTVSQFAALKVAEYQAHKRDAWKRKMTPADYIEKMLDQRADKVKAKTAERKQKTKVEKAKQHEQIAKKTVKESKSPTGVEPTVKKAGIDAEQRKALKKRGFTDTFIDEMRPQDVAATLAVPPEDVALQDAAAFEEAEDTKLAEQMEAEAVPQKPTEPEIKETEVADKAQVEEKEIVKPEPSEKATEEKPKPKPKKKPKIKGPIKHRVYNRSKEEGKGKIKGRVPYWARKVQNYTPKQLADLKTTLEKAVEEDTEGTDKMARVYLKKIQDFEAEHKGQDVEGVSTSTKYKEAYAEKDLQTMKENPLSEEEWTSIDALTKKPGLFSFAKKRAEKAGQDYQDVLDELKVRIAADIAKGKAKGENVRLSFKTAKQHIANIIKGNKPVTAGREAEISTFSIADDEMADVDTLRAVPDTAAERDIDLRKIDLDNAEGIVKVEKSNALKRLINRMKAPDPISAKRKRELDIAIKKGMTRVTQLEAAKAAQKKMDPDLRIQKEIDRMLKKIRENQEERAAIEEEAYTGQLGPKGRAIIESLEVANSIDKHKAPRQFMSFAKVKKQDKGATKRWGKGNSKKIPLIESMVDQWKRREEILSTAVTNMQKHGITPDERVLTELDLARKELVNFQEALAAASSTSQGKIITSQRKRPKPKPVEGPTGLESKETPKAKPKVEEEVKPEPVEEAIEVKPPKRNPTLKTAKERWAVATKLDGTIEAKKKAEQEIKELIKEAEASGNKRSANAIKGFLKNVVQKHTSKLGMQEDTKAPIDVGKKPTESKVTDADLRKAAKVMARVRREDFSRVLKDDLTVQETTDLMVEMVKQGQERGEPYLINDANPGQPEWSIKQAWEKVKPAKRKVPTADELLAEDISANLQPDPATGKTQKITKEMLETEKRNLLEGYTNEYMQDDTMAAIRREAAEKKKAETLPTKQVPKIKPTIKAKIQARRAERTKLSFDPAELGIHMDISVEAGGAEYFAKRQEGRTINNYELDIDTGNVLRSEDALNWDNVDSLIEAIESVEQATEEARVKKQQLLAALDPHKGKGALALEPEELTDLIKSVGIDAITYANENEGGQAILILNKDIIGTPGPTVIAPSRSTVTKTVTKEEGGGEVTQRPVSQKELDQAEKEISAEAWDEAVALFNEEESDASLDDILAGKEPPKKKKKKGSKAKPPSELDMILDQVIENLPSKKNPLNNQRGSSPELGALWDGFKRMGEMVKDKGEALHKWLDVEAPWIKRGYHKTGQSIKNFFGRKTARQEQGYKLMRQFMGEIHKGFGRKATDAELEQLLLAYENRDYYLFELNNEQRAQMKRGIEWLDNFFTQTQQEYKNRGHEVDFKKRMMAKLETEAKYAKTPQERQKMLERIWQVEQMSFASIPVAAIALDSSGILSKKQQKKADARDRKRMDAILEMSKKRKVLSLWNMKKSGKFDDMTFKPIDVIANYVHRVSKDMALLDIRDAMLEDGVIKKAKMGMKRPSGHETLGRGYGVLGGHFVTPEGKHAIDNLMSVSEAQTAYDRLIGATKMMAFYNPFFLPLYDIVQFGMSGAWAGKQIVGIPKNFFMAIKDVYTGSDSYLEAMREGLFSKPFDNPFQSYRDRASAIGAVGETTWQSPILEQLYKAGKDIKNFKQMTPSLIGAVYNASWNLAWSMDESIRMWTYHTLKSTGMTANQAAQTAAKYHGDYASVPPKTRRVLNRIFFTPTFKIVMGKLYYNAAKNLVTAPLDKIQGKDIQADRKYIARAALGMLAMNAAFDLVMRNMGWEPDDDSLFNRGRRYTKEVIDEYGRKNKIVVTWSHPGNLIQRYWQKIAQAYKTTDSVPKGIWRVLNTDVHPLYRAALSMAENRDATGSEIWNENDSTGVKALRQLSYAAGQMYKISDELPNLVDTVMKKTKLESESKLLAKAAIEDMSTLAWWLLDSPFAVASAHMKSNEDQRDLRDIQGIIRRAKRDQKLHTMQHGVPNPEWIENMRNRVQEKAETIMERQQRAKERRKSILGD